jgi:hypothetical protein
VVVRFFRINDPYRLVAIIVLMVIASLPLFINTPSLMMHELEAMVVGEGLGEGFKLYSQLFTSMPPLFAWLSNWMFTIFGQSEIAWRFFALFILFFQMSLFTIILINNKAHHENTYLPGLIFGMLALFSFDMLSVSPELLASTMMLLALNELFKEIEFRIQRDAIVHRVGFYTGLASLFAFNYVIFLPGVILILAIFARLSSRKALLLVFGFLLPHAILILFYYLRGDMYWLIQNFYSANIFSEDKTAFTLTSLFVLGAVPVLFLLLSLVMLNREARLTKYQSQLMQVMLLWIPLSLLVLLFGDSTKPHHLIIFIPSFSYFISHYILLIRRKRLAEITWWFFVVSIMVVLYLSRYDHFKPVNNQSLYVSETTYKQITGKKILVLTDDKGLLLHNTLATGFYDWKLSERVFTQQDYFENVMLVSRAFEHEKPQLIVDPQNLMQHIFNRIPSLKSQYKKEGEFYVKLN